MNFFTDILFCLLQIRVVFMAILFQKIIGSYLKTVAEITLKALLVY